MKSQIRKNMLGRRNSLPLEYIQKSGAAFYENLLKSGCLPSVNPMQKKLRQTEALGKILYPKPPLVMLYHSFRKEASTMTIKDRLLEKGFDLCLPVTFSGAGSQPDMQAYPITRKTRFAPDAFGVPTPLCQDVLPVDPSQISLIIVPGVAFDPQGNRLGFGKGFYDRFLPRAPQALKVALAYDFQLIHRLPREPWDIKMDYIITESRIISCI